MILVIYSVSTKLDDSEAILALHRDVTLRESLEITHEHWISSDDGILWSWGPENGRAIASGYFR